MWLTEAFDHRTVFPHMPNMVSSSLIVSSNPIRMAQFSYQLVTGCIADIIPLFVRIQRNSGDSDAVRQLVALFMNRLYQAKDSYEQSVTRGVMQVSSISQVPSQQRTTLTLDFFRGVVDYR